MQADRTNVDFHSYGRFYKLDSEVNSEQAFFDFNDEYKYWSEEYDFDAMVNSDFDNEDNTDYNSQLNFE